VEKLYIIVISQNKKLSQIVQASLESSPNNHQDQYQFIVNHYSPSEVPSQKILERSQAFIIDFVFPRNKENPHDLSKFVQVSQKPLIIISDKGKPNIHSYTSENQSLINLSITDISSNLFHPYIVSTIAKAELTKKLDDVQSGLTKQIEELQFLNQANLNITQDLSLDHVLEQILETAISIIDADDSRIYLYEEKEQLSDAGWGFDQVENESTKLSHPQEKTYLITKGGKVEIVDEKGLHPLFIYDDWTGSVFDLDLKVGQSEIGGIAVGFKQRHYFSKFEKQIVKMLADQAAIAIENARLYKQAKHYAVLEERNRLARELHDSVAQSLFGIMLLTKASIRYQEQQKNEIIETQLSDILETAKEALKEMRLLIFELRPIQLEFQGLIPALTARLEAVEERSGITVDFTFDGNLVVSNQIEDCLYRIAQESLNNILKHAKADNITVSLVANRDQTRLIIQDNGVGFVPEQIQSSGGFGFKCMKERVEKIGGELIIKSYSGEGTLISVEVPNE